MFFENLRVFPMVDFGDFSGHVPEEKCYLFFSFSRPNLTVLRDHQI